ncbi:MAG TPA: metallophosphoesterase [Candidatus Omnitrophota bacterium]|nr:metallophosphoesterase [Candidatus Omnitrophota bacterium]
MNAAWLTDIHLNFLKHDQLEEFLLLVSEETVDCFFVSGDIGEADKIIDYLKHAESVLKRPIYFVLGNHDYYEGSIKGTRSMVADLVKNSENLIWLNAVDSVSLSTHTVLIGHDSWADGRFGDFYRSSVELNDFYLIDELKTRDRTLRLSAIQELANEAAEHFRRVLPLAVKKHNRIIVLTHVPPFKEATWHEGQISGDDWLPFFSCKVVGNVLKNFMEKHPMIEMTVLCGHTHSFGQCEVLPNLKVVTGRAEYGVPQIQRILDII